MDDRKPSRSPSTSLPPPPAPTAPDANPWVISSQAAARPDRPRGKPMPHRANQPTTGPTASPAETSAQRRGISRYIPFAIFAAVIAAFAAGALDAAQAGDYVGALVPLVFLGIIVVGWWRSVRRAKGRRE